MGDNLRKKHNSGSVKCENENMSLLLRVNIFNIDILLELIMLS